VLPVLESPNVMIPRVKKYLRKQKYESRGKGPEVVFAWKATRFMRLRYTDDAVQLEAWAEGEDADAQYEAMLQQIDQVELILLQAEDEDEEEACAPLPEAVKATKLQYLRKYAGKEFEGNLRFLAIMGYVMLVPLGLLAITNYAIVLDVVILLAMNLGMHLGRNKFCALGMTAYAVLNFALSMGGSGLLVGWIALGAFGFMQIRKAEKQYDALIREHRENRE
jgi:hypothetical protein